MTEHIEMADSDFLTEEQQVQIYDNMCHDNIALDITDLFILAIDNMANLIARNYMAYSKSMTGLDLISQSYEVTERLAIKDYRNYLDTVMKKGEKHGLQSSISA